MAGKMLYFYFRKASILLVFSVLFLSVFCAAPTCGDPGDPCIRSGFGCSRHSLPTDPEIWEYCAGKQFGVEMLQAVEEWQYQR